MLEKSISSYSLDILVKCPITCIVATAKESVKMSAYQPPINSLHVQTVTTERYLLSTLKKSCYSLATYNLVLITKLTYQRSLVII